MRLFRLKIALLVGCLILGGVVFAVAQEDLTYPILELGNCSNRTACEAYCEKPENMKSCLNFAEVHSLLSEEEIEAGQRMLVLGMTGGPGGCKGMEECEAYCDQIGHIKECIVFAEKNNLIPPDELEQAKKVIQAMDRGLTPPNCKSKKDCDAYCFLPEHMEECIVFGEAAGIIPPEELQDAKKMLVAMKKGVKPPACQGKQECDIYCNQSEHMLECMEFGIAAGFMPPEEIENAKKTLKALKQGVRPPNCQGKEKCDLYCSQPEHMEECIAFGEAAGFISAEDAARARKTAELGITGGPGNCRGEEECNVYCQVPEHMEECINSSVANGSMTPEEAEQAKQRMRMIQLEGKCATPEECNQYCLQNPQDSVCQAMMPSEEVPPPQSLFDRIQNFLANISSFFSEINFGTGR